MENKKKYIPTQWIIKSISEQTGLPTKEILDMLEEKRKFSTDPQWDEKTGLIDIAMELGVYISFDPGEEFTTVGYIPRRLEDIDIDDLESSLEKIYEVFKDKDVEDEDKYMFYRRIVGQTDVFIHFDTLLRLITRIPKRYEECGWDFRYDALEYMFDTMFEKSGVRRKNMICFKCHYIFDIILDQCPRCKSRNIDIQKELQMPIGYKVSMIERFPQFLQFLESLDYRPYHMSSTFKHMIHRINYTEVMETHFSLIETTFKKIVDDYFELPEYLGKHLTKQDVFNVLLDTIRNTKLLQNEVPYFVDLCKLIPNDYGYDSTPYYLLLLMSAMKGKKTEGLKLVLEKLMDAFHEIHNNENLFQAFSTFLEKLLDTDPKGTKAVIKRKISVFQKNLSSFKTRLPALWEDIVDL